MDVDATITLSYTATADCAKSWKAASGFTNTYVPGLVAIGASDTITLGAELVDDTEGITWSNSCGLATEFTLEADVDKCGAAAGDSLANCPFITILGNVITIDMKVLKCINYSIISGDASVKKTAEQVSLPVPTRTAR